MKKSLLSRRLGFLEGQNGPPRAQKQAKTTFLCIPNGSGSLLEKRSFDPFFTFFLVSKWPVFKTFRHFRLTGSQAQNELKPLVLASHVV